KDIHAIIDNYATHKHPKVREWLSKLPRWTFHFPPPSPPWPKPVEGFSPTSPRKPFKRAEFRLVADLNQTTNRFLEETNSNPKPFVWTADPKRVLAAVKRGKQALESVH